MVEDGTSFQIRTYTDLYLYIISRTYTDKKLKGKKIQLLIDRNNAVYNYVVQNIGLLCNMTK